MLVHAGLHATNYNQVPLGTAEPPGTPAPCRSAISTCLYSAPVPDTTTPDKVYRYIVLRLLHHSSMVCLSIASQFRNSRKLRSYTMYKMRTRIGIVGFDLSLGRKVSAHTCHIVAAYGGHADTAALLFIVSSTTLRARSRLPSINHCCN